MSFRPVHLLLPLTLLSSGCIKSMLLNGQISSTRQASAAFDTIHDWELAEKAASAGIVQFEGMHVLAPDNNDALFLLTKAWTGYAYGFIEDVLQDADDASDRALAEHHRGRAVAGYERAIGYGLELIGKNAPGFEEARKGEASMKAWLDKSFKSKEDAANLFWPAYAWIARTSLRKDDADLVANLWVGVLMMEKSVELDPDYNNSSGTIVLAAYHARTAMSEIDQAKAMFEGYLAKTNRKALLGLFNYAASYACVRADAELYQKLLREVVAAEDLPPHLRLMNTIAKRRARRWLQEKRMFDVCGIELPPASGGAASDNTNPLERNDHDAS